MAISSKWTVFSLLPFLLFSVVLWAQIDKGTVNGTVTDQSGACLLYTSGRQYFQFANRASFAAFA